MFQSASVNVLGGLQGSATEATDEVLRRGSEVQERLKKEEWTKRRGTYRTTRLIDGLTLAMEAKTERVPSTAGPMIDSGSSAWRWKGEACVVQWGCASQSLNVGRRAVERTHSVSHSVDALDSLIEGSLLSDILNDDKLQRLALEEVLDVLSLSDPNRPSESAPSSVAKPRQRARGRARTLETDRTVPTTLKPASKKALTT